MDQAKDITLSAQGSPPSPENTLVPRLAFLGWCDGFARVENPLTHLLQTNLLGLSEIRISHIYPLSLKGMIAVLAFYRLEVGEQFEMVFRGSAGTPAFAIQAKIDSAQQTDLLRDETTEVSPGAFMPGWFLHGARIDSDIVVNEPGQYDVFHKTSDGEIYLGKVFFFHAPAQPLTPEEIAALRSDPFALKQVRVAYSCGNCKKGLRAYVGFERNADLETEGWIWAEMLPEEFVCDCQKFKIKLVYLRTGLQGLLRRRMEPVSSAIGSVRLYETTALEQKCRDFKRLLEKDGKEERLQKFLESNPIFFSRFNPKKLMFKKPVLSKFFVDFAVLNERRELLLIEIENASTRLLKKDGGVRAELQHAVDQVRLWKQEFEDHRAAALSCLDIKLEDVVKVKGIVVAGRTPKNDLEARLLRTVAWPDVEFYTFDDLISGAVEIIRHVAVG